MSNEIVSESESGWLAGDLGILASNCLMMIKMGYTSGHSLIVDLLSFINLEIVQAPVEMIGEDLSIWSVIKQVV